jgi:hypothetical protein
MPQREAPFFAKVAGQPDVQPERDGDFFQPKLTVGQPGDVFEQEADAVADAVVSSQASLESTTVDRKELVQSQTAPEEEALQTRLQRQGMEEEEEPLQRQPMDEERESVQTQAMEEEEEPVQAEALEEEEPVQAAPDVQAPPLSGRLAQQRGKGHPLPPGTQAEMEASLGTDFSGVRVHTGEEAALMNNQLRAQAFTSGQDIYFNEGKFSPESRSGRHLLAHELTHVVQQRKQRP